MSPHQDKKERVEPSHVEMAIIIVARAIEALPCNEYKVLQRVLDELGYEFVPSKIKK